MEPSRDLLGAVARWNRHGLASEVGSAPTASLGPQALADFLGSVLDRARALVDSPGRPPATGPGDVVIVTKAPHVVGRRSVTAVVARLLAFGADVRGVHMVDRSAMDVAEVLYPITARHYADLPAESSALWSALTERFDVEEFRTVFGIAFEHKLVVPARQVIGENENELDEATFSAIWCAGRKPLRCNELKRDYGGRPTCHALRAAVAYEKDFKRKLGHTWLHRAVGRPIGRSPEHTWFRCPLPLGIQRIGSGLMAFALRHPKIYGGRPTVVLNGHFLGLASLFEGPTYVIDVALSPTVTMADLRRWVIGTQVAPHQCQPGSIRHDALRRRFPVDSDREVDARANLLHCSDGLLAGARERAALLGQPPAGALIDRLGGCGLTAEEITDVVLANPLVGTPGSLRHLTDLTAGSGLDECIATVLQHVPPVFGERNGHGSGVRLSTFGGRVAEFVAVGGDTSRYPEAVERRRRPRRPIPKLAGLDTADDRRGQEAIATGAVGLLVPAGGTGGRFGGYDLPEHDPRRHKPLAPLFRLDGVERSALDVRLANALHWRRATAASLPVAVMASATNEAAIGAWRDRWTTQGVEGLVTFLQHGVYRITVAGLAELVAGGRADRWIDHVLRREDGSPSLKPFGALGCLTAFALRGLYERWRAAGVETLVISSADDAAFRLDPRVLGHMEANELDAVVLGVPQGFRARLTLHDGRTTELRGDRSGWCVDDTGRPCTIVQEDADRAWVCYDDQPSRLATVTVDVGGVISEVERTDGRWSLAVVEGLDPVEAAHIGWSFCANQLYLRCSALDHYLARGTDGVAELLDALPTFAEHKNVEGSEAVQFVQPVAGVLRVLDRVGALSMQRSPVDGQRGGYGAIKERADVPFTQQMLDILARRPGGDELWLPDLR